MLAILLILAVCFTLVPAVTASAGASTDIPSAYVVYDETHYYLIHYEDLLDAYMYYVDNPHANEAKLAKFYFDTLAMGFEAHFIAYVSGVTHKYVDFGAVLDQFIDTESIDEAYGWFNTDAATSAFNMLTELKVLGPDASVTGSVFVGPDGYETAVLIDNPSVEIVDPNDSTVPQNWSHNSWGSHTAAFSYLNEGHTGNRSVKVEVTGHVDGDAKWYFHPLALEPGDYVFSDYYRCSVDTKVNLAVTTNTGDTQYFVLPPAPASEDWTKYEAIFSMPEDAVTATVFHLLTQDGYLITDDYHIDPYRYEGFDRGLLTITFDDEDGWEATAQNALPMMQQYGFKSEHFFTTTNIENSSVSNPKEIIQQYIDDGHEIASHSITHPDLTTLSQQDLIDELEGSKDFLEDYLGISIKYFASPYGAYNGFVKDSIMTYYSAHRTVDMGYNSKDNLDTSRLKCMCILSFHHVRRV